MSISQGTRALVTGANGFIGGHLVQQLLERGYSVTGTVRDPDSARVAYLRDLPQASDRLSLVAADILDPASLAAALAGGCDVLFHTASPVIFRTDDPENDLVRPARDGTRNALEAAQAAGVSRVVVTSSVATVLNAHDFSTPFTEEDWNTRSSLENGELYRFSKVLAERTVWDFVAKQGDALAFGVATVLPSLVLGPGLPGYAGSNAGLDIVKKYALGQAAAAYAGGTNWVDVRDVALQHILASQVPEAVGERFLCASESTSWAEVCAGLQEAFPELPVTSTVVDEPDPSSDLPGEGTPLIANDKARRVLGMVYRPWRETVADLAATGVVQSS